MRLQLTLTRIILKLVAVSSSCINPIFYGWLNRAFRSEAVELIKRCGGPSCIQRHLKQVTCTTSNYTDYV